jgi:predicted lipoprotein with Yx(FWY)xxD motif
MKALLVLVISLVVTVGCGSDKGEDPKPTEPAQPDAATDADKSPTHEGTLVILDASEFGRMLFDSKKQAIYIFERDQQNKSNCYGECAVAWPPVFTEGRPRAGKGVDSSLLGTIKRRDGKRQVTYAGKPLYYYAHEDPGEVKCHNVNLNGGFWWAVGSDGKRLH